MKSCKMDDATQASNILAVGLPIWYHHLKVTSMILENCIIHSFSLTYWSIQPVLMLNR